MEGYYGEVRLIGSVVVPAGWLPCDGRLLQINDFIILYNAVGNSFGGDGFRTFALPTLPSPAPGVRYVICVQGFWPSRLYDATLAELRLFCRDATRTVERVVPSDGRLLPISQNTALFSLLETRFGGDNVRTFGIPNASAPDGMQYLLPLEGIFPRRF